MDRSRPDQILESWRSVAASAVQPATAPRRTTVRSSLPGLSLAGLLVASLLVAVVWIGLPGSDDGTGVIPTASPSPTPSATAEPTPAGTSTPVPSIIADGMFGTCRVSDLSARITAWQGAAGSRIATVEMTFDGTVACWIPVINKVQLLDGTGAVRIDGAIPTQADGLQLDKGDVATTLVRTSDYCGPTPIAPISLAFWSFQGSLVTASPFSPDDATMPPCESQSGSGQIEMEPWSDGGPEFGTCHVEDLTAAITAWEGAAGSRIATVVLTHAGAERCWIPSKAALHLIDATGAILISGPSDRDLAEINQLSVDDRLTTLVRTSNYCGDAPVAPVTIVFVSDTTGTEVVAAPYSSTDDTVPPCNGPGEAGTIEMQPWTR